MELIQVNLDFEEELKEFEGSFEWDEIVDIKFWKNKLCNFVTLKNEKIIFEIIKFLITIMWELAFWKLGKIIIYKFLKPCLSL